MKLYRKIRRNFRKIKRWIFHPFRTAKNKTRRTVKKTINTYIKTAIITYLILLIPANLLSVSDRFLSFDDFNIKDAFSEITTKDYKSLLTGGFSDLIGNISTPKGEYAENEDLRKFPEYYEILGKSEINENNFPSEGNIEYEGFDNLGRTLSAKGTITHKMVQDRKGVRIPFEGGSDPSGYPTGKNFKNEEIKVIHPNGKVYNGHFYNRSHLIANQLGGEATKRNVVTGTRAQNVGSGSGGMRYPEKKAVDYLNSKKDAVMYYEAIPHYEGSELVPRYVIVNIKSKGGEIDEKIKVYNQQNGWSINYQTGEFKPSR